MVDSVTSEPMSILDELKQDMEQQEDELRQLDAELAALHSDCEARDAECAQLQAKHESALLAFMKVHAMVESAKQRIAHLSGLSEFHSLDILQMQEQIATMVFQQHANALRASAASKRKNVTYTGAIAVQRELDLHEQLLSEAVKEALEELRGHDSARAAKECHYPSSNAAHAKTLSQPSRPNAHARTSSYARPTAVHSPTATPEYVHTTQVSDEGQSYEDTMTSVAARPLSRGCVQTVPAQPMSREQLPMTAKSLILDCLQESGCADAAAMYAFCKARNGAYVSLPQLLGAVDELIEEYVIFQDSNAGYRLL